MIAAILISAMLQSFPNELTPNSGGYLCIAADATGFSWSEQRGWYQANFRTDDMRYIFRPAREGESFGELDWVWANFGENGPSAITQRCSSEEFSANWSICGAGSSRFTFNFLTLRYVRTSTNSYPIEFLAERTLELGVNSPEFSRRLLP